MPIDNSSATTRSMLVDERFTPVAATFFAMFRRPEHCGGALAIRLHGKPVLDIWAGWATPERHWQHDTLVLSFSTGKGAAASVIHRLVDRGLIRYDSPVAAYWPEFAAQGKQDITVRDILNHRAGLHRLGDWGLDMPDHDRLAAALAASPADPSRANVSAYHAITFGTLVAEIAQRVTGTTFSAVVREELAAPLGDKDFWFGVPPSERHRLAQLPTLVTAPGGKAMAKVGDRLPVIKELNDAGRYCNHELSKSPQRPYEIMMPGWNGTFTARSLATMYGTIANSGQIEGRQFYSDTTMSKITEMSSNSRFDRVLGISPQFALGYHRGPFGKWPFSRKTLGHFGMGGSGAVAIPDLGLSVAFVTNHHSGTLPVLGDTRMVRLVDSAARAASR